jgi:periplasmic divalent cation tolerance protein
MKETEIVFGYMTFPNRDEARRMGRVLVDRKLAACVNIIDGMESIYSWEGKVETAQEAILIAKTTRAASAELMTAVLEGHPYECPCVVWIPISGGNPAYLRWVENGVVP